MNGTDSPSRTASAPRVVGWLALAGVSLIAGVASYFHALSVVEASGASAPVAYLVPALADLVILGASADLLAASRANQGRPRLTMIALAVGIIVTLGMNVAAASPHDVPKWLVNGWPALAFTLALESLAGLVRRGRDGTALSAVPAASSQEPPTVEAAWKQLRKAASQRQLAELLDMPRSRIQAIDARLAAPAETAELNGATAHV